MGCCVSKGLVKVVPKSKDNNLVSAKHSLKSEINYGLSLSELPEDTGRGNSGEKVIHFAEKDQSAVRGESKFKKEERQDTNGDGQIMTISDHDTNDQLKEKRELPKLVKTIGYRADFASRKPVAFDIGFHENRFILRSIPRKYPRKLEKLEGAPHLTAELLQQKQDLAEKNRFKELKKKAETTSKRRREILQAREYERTRNVEIKMNAKYLATERNRQSQVEGIIFKQKRREQKARSVRAKALSLNDNEDSLVHVDETYNSDGSEGEFWQDDNRCYEESEINIGKESKEDVSSTDEFFERGPPV